MRSSSPGRLLHLGEIDLVGLQGTADLVVVERGAAGGQLPLVRVDLLGEGSEPVGGQRRGPRLVGTGDVVLLQGVGEPFAGSLEELRGPGHVAIGDRQRLDALLDASVPLLGRLDPVDEARDAGADGAEVGGPLEIRLGGQRASLLVRGADTDPGVLAQITGQGLEQLVDLVDGRARITGAVPCGYVYVDGSSVGGATEELLKDRRILRDEGFISVMVVVDSSSGKVVAGPEITARGFAEDDEIFTQVKPKIIAALDEAARKGTTDTHQLQQVVRRTMGQWIARKLRRKPMIIPVVVEAGKDK